MSTLDKHVILKRNEDRRLKTGHQWIFSNEIHRIVGAPADGDVVEILRADGEPLGIGFFNGHSLIAVRVLERTVVDIDARFFAERIRSAYQMRRQLFPESDTFRVVHGESDFLPGLVVDKFGGMLAVQTFSAGMDQRLEVICSALQEVLTPTGIVERNESPLRSLEGIPLRSGLLVGSAEPVVVELNGLKFTVDVLNGQKSGFFLDQRENRTTIRTIVRDAEVLDCFCNEGGFGLYAAAFGARRVEGVDSSSEAIERARANAALNGLSTIEFHTDDAFRFLEEAAAAGRRWNVVILDPPSFAKSRKNLPAALRGYKDINASGLRCLSSPGYLVSASCSHHVDQAAFLNILTDSGVKAGRRVKVLSLSGASPDHPVLPSMPETQYLTCAVCRVE